MNAAMKHHLELVGGSVGRKQEEAPLYTVRRATTQDIPSISSLGWEFQWAVNIYGFRKVVETMEHAVLCAVAETSDGDMVGYCVFNNYPDETVVSRQKWRPWVLQMAPLLEPEDVNSIACLFMTELICDEAKSQHVIGAFMGWIFTSMPDLEYVFHAIKCNHHLLTFLTEAGFRMISDHSSPTPLLEANRAKFVPRLASRHARLEDHDDLRDMFSHDEDRLTERYGNYFLAAFIADPSPSSLSVVLEIQKVAMGIMSVTTDIDFDLLNANFELTPFHGLRKPSDGDITGVQSTLTEEMLANRSSAKLEEERKALASLDASKMGGFGDISHEGIRDHKTEKSLVDTEMSKIGTHNAEQEERAEKTASESQVDLVKPNARRDQVNDENAAIDPSVMVNNSGSAKTKTGSGHEVLPKGVSKSESGAVKGEPTDIKASETLVEKNTSKSVSKMDEAVTVAEERGDINVNEHTEDEAATSETTKAGSKTDGTASKAGMSTEDTDIGVVSKGTEIEVASKKSDFGAASGSADVGDESKATEIGVESKGTNIGEASKKGDIEVASNEGNVGATPRETDIGAPSGLNTVPSASNEGPIILEQLWGAGTLESRFNQPRQPEAPIPDDEVPDDTKPVLELIWGYPVSADGRVTRQVSGPVSGLSEVTAAGPPPAARDVPQYCGAPNAAAVQLFCLRENHKSRAVDLLPAVLTLMPEIDYIVLTVSAEEPETPLTRLMTRVPRRARSTFPGELYLFHRASLFTDLEVLPASTNDLGSIRTLVKYTKAARQILESIREIFMDGSAHDTVFVVRCHEQIVGVVVVRPESEMEYIRSHFDIEEYIQYELHAPREGFGHLYHFVLNPIFQRFTHYVLAEVMRLTTLTVILYPLFPPGAEDMEGHSPTPVLERMWPVNYRRQIEYPLQAGTLGENIPAAEILQIQEPMSLQLITHSSVLKSRARINSRIVVVGGGDAGLSVLKTLVFSRELLFTNLTLVEPHGFQGETAPTEEAADMLTSSENFPKVQLHTMWLHAWVNLVRGEMRSIDRKRKCIKIDSAREEIPYDHLILTCGQQFQIPKRLVPQTTRPYQERRPLFPPANLPAVPENVFRVSSQFSAERALEYVRAYCLERSENIVIYGRYLEVFTCLASLIKLPVPLHRLVLVFPIGRHKEKIQLTDDPAVDAGIFHRVNMQEEGIRIFEGYELTFWDVKSNNRVYRIQLTNQTEDGPPERYLSCCGLFVYDRKGVEVKTFKALNDASLVFDGKLCIDHTFGTNDASIKAVGTMTKYSRRYYAEGLDHSQFNSYDVGRALGGQILADYGDTTQIKTSKPSAMERRRSSIPGPPLPPEFTMPLVVRARLPDDWQLLQIAAPRLRLDLDPEAVLVTGDPVFPSATGYMRIEISRYRIVQKITCFSQNAIEVENMISLYGLHEVLLNNMVARYREGLIPDLYLYFRQPWAMMLFHDRFRRLLDDIRQAMLSCPSREGKFTLEQKVVDCLCRYNELSQEEHIRLLEDFRSGGVDQLVESWMLQYLANNYYHLPMYAREGTSDLLKISGDGSQPGSAGTSSLKLSRSVSSRYSAESSRLSASSDTRQAASPVRKPSVDPHARRASADSKAKFDGKRSSNVFRKLSSTSAL